jgi:hypothetical protein
MRLAAAQSRPPRRGPGNEQQGPAAAAAAGAGLVVPGVGAPGGALEVAEVAGETGAVAAAEARVDADLCAAAAPSGGLWIVNHGPFAKHGLIGFRVIRILSCGEDDNLYFPLSTCAAVDVVQLSGLLLNLHRLRIILHRSKCWQFRTMEYLTTFGRYKTSLSNQVKYLHG